MSDAWLERSFSKSSNQVLHINKLEEQEEDEEQGRNLVDEEEKVLWTNTGSELCAKGCLVKSMVYHQVNGGNL